MMERPTNVQIAQRMQDDYTVTGDRWFKYAADALRAQPEYLTGCRHPGNEPKSCQYEGQCLSVSCNHHGKTWRAPRMTVLARDPNVLYPKVER